MSRRSRTLEEAVCISQLHGETWWDAEVQRMRGELLALQKGEQREARAALERAVAIALEQEAAMLEQRARESLAALGSNAAALTAA